VKLVQQVQVNKDYLLFSKSLYLKPTKKNIKMAHDVAINQFGQSAGPLYAPLLNAKQFFQIQPIW